MLRQLTYWQTIMGTVGNLVRREPGNKGKLVGQKAPFKLKDIWALRVRLQMEGRVGELALLSLGFDSKLRGCDLVALRSGTCVTANRWPHVPSASSTRPSGRFSSRSHAPLATPCRRGSSLRGRKRRTSSSPAGFTIRPISELGSTLGSLGTWSMN